MIREELDRRAFLQAVLAAGLLLHAPAAAAEGLSEREAWRLEVLRQAWRAAAAAGRPLLLIGIPEDSAEQLRVGQAWGLLLGYGSDEGIARLAQAEVATATQADLARLLPDYEPREQAPLLVAIEAAAVPSSWRVIDGAVPRDTYPSPEDLKIVRRLGRRDDSARWAYEQRRMREDGDAKIDALEAAIRAALPPVEALDPGAIAERRAASPPGSRWVSNSGCGDHSALDPLDPGAGRGPGFQCGMGYVPERSRRFLDFLVEEVGE